MQLPSVFLDTSAVVTALLSATGGGRELLRLGEVQAIHLYVGPSVISELDEVLRKKAPHVVPVVALALDAANVRQSQLSVGDSLDAYNLRQYLTYAPDAIVLAEALAARCDYFVTLDQRHFLNNTALRTALAIPMGTPGDCLLWYRNWLTQRS